MDEQDIDMTTFAELFDVALTSDNPIVKDQLRKLLMVAALTAPGKVAGPFKQILDELAELQRAFRRLQDQLNRYDDASKWGRSDALKDEYLKGMMSKMTASQSMQCNPLIDTAQYVKSIMKGLE